MTILSKACLVPNLHRSEKVGLVDTAPLADHWEDFRNIVKSLLLSSSSFYAEVLLQVLLAVATCPNQDRRDLCFDRMQHGKHRCGTLCVLNTIEDQCNVFPACLLFPFLRRSFACGSVRQLCRILNRGISFTDLLCFCF